MAFDKGAVDPGLELSSPGFDYKRSTYDPANVQITGGVATLGSLSVTGHVSSSSSYGTGLSTAQTVGGFFYGTSEANATFNFDMSTTSGTYRAAHYGVSLVPSISGSQTVLSGYDGVRVFTGGSERVTVPTGGGLVVRSPTGSGTILGTGRGEGLRIEAPYVNSAWRSLVETPVAVGQDIPVAKIAAQINGFGSKIALGTSNSYVSGVTNTGLVLNENGIVTKPNHPMFSALRVGGSHQTAAGVIEFASVMVNSGSCYNTSNYRFTAPQDGAYWFTADLFVNMPNAASYAYGSFIKNGSGFGTTWHTSFPTASSIYYQRVSISAAIYLAAGDYVQVYMAGVNAGAGIYSSTYSSFQGFLIG